MQVITSFTTSPNQFHELILENNETANFTLRYYPRMTSWFFDISYGDKTINGVKVVLHPNILRQFKNILPFGLMFYTDNGSPVEPFQPTDFQTGRVKMAILNKEEVLQVESEVFNVEDKSLL